MYNNVINHCDVLEGLKKVKSNSADIIIGDPPYNIGKDFGIYKDKVSLKKYIDWCDSWVKESLRVLKPTGTMYIYGYSEILPYLFVNIQCEYKKWIIWHYTNKNSPKVNFWQRSHESILVCSKEKTIFNTDDVREPYTESFLQNSVGKKRAATIGRFNKNENETLYTAHPNGALPRDVIKVPALAGGAGLKEKAYYCTSCNTFLLGSKNKKSHNLILNHEVITHPTQKPLILTRKLIKAVKNKNNTDVIILFSGSGAEAVAAYKEDCSFIGFDNNINYVNMGNRWIESILKK